MPTIIYWKNYHLFTTELLDARLLLIYLQNLISIELGIERETRILILVYLIVSYYTLHGKLIFMLIKKHCKESCLIEQLILGLSS